MPGVLLSSTAITMRNVVLGTPVPYGVGTANFLSADTFNNTWGADDKIYMTSCDCGTWNQTDWTFGRNGSNFMVSTLSSFDPTTAVGTLVNTMVSSYGNSGQQGDDDAGWKTSGLASIHGTFLLAACRQYEQDVTETHLQATLVKSTNGFTDYTPTSTMCPTSTPPDYTTHCNYSDITPLMFPNVQCGSPTFIQYGKDYVGQTVHRSSEYVYLAMPGGNFNKDVIYLSRVLISDIASLDSSKYSYYTGGDGASDENWASTVASAAVIVNDPGHIGMTSINYMPYFQEYCMIQWYRKSGYSLPGPQVTQFFFWKSSTPWGPWAKFYTSPEYDETLNNYAPYQPCIVQKSVATDGGRNIVLLVPGNVGNNYKPYFVPCALT